VRLKQWLIKEAATQSCTPHTLRMRLWRGVVRMPELRRKNARVIEVVIEEPDTLKREQRAPEPAAAKPRSEPGTAIQRDGEVCA